MGRRRERLSSPEGKTRRRGRKREEEESGSEGWEGGKETGVCFDDGKPKSFFQSVLITEIRFSAETSSHIVLYVHAQLQFVESDVLLSRCPLYLPPSFFLPFPRSPLLMLPPTPRLSFSPFLLFPSLQGVSAVRVEKGSSFPAPSLP